MLSYHIKIGLASMHSMEWFDEITFITGVGINQLQAWTLSAYFKKDGSAITIC